MIRTFLLFIFFPLVIVGSGFTNPLENFLFSGKLGTTSSGSMVGTTVVSMTAKLYSAQSGGSASYIQVFPSVEINEGYFSLEIGPALPDLINHSWLELTVQGSTLSPRRRLPAMPFAIQAANAQIALDSQTLQGLSLDEIRNSLFSELGANVSTGQIDLGITTLDAETIGTVNLAVLTGSIEHLQVNTLEADTLTAEVVDANRFIGDGSSLTNVWHTSDEISTPYIEAMTLSDGTGIWTQGVFSANEIQAMTVVAGTVAADFFVGDGSSLTGVLVSGESISATELNATTLSDGLAVLSGGSLFVGAVEATGTVTATAFVGDGSGLSGVLLSGASISAPEISVTTLSDGLAFLSGGSLYVGDVEATGTVTAAAFVGDGSGLSGVLLSGGDISAGVLTGTTITDGVATLWNGDLVVGNVDASGAVTASIFHGDGSALLNLPTPVVLASGNTSIEIDTTTTGTIEHIDISVDGVERMIITSRGVGIGVSSPTDALEVDGNISANQLTVQTVSTVEMSASVYSGDGSGLSGVLHPGDALSTSETLTLTGDGGKGLVIEHSSSESADTTKIVIRGASGADHFRVDIEGDVYSGALDVLDTSFSGFLRHSSSTLYGEHSNTHINLGTLSESGTSGTSYFNISITGGQSNVAANDFASIGAGNQNTASGYNSRVGGGEQNIASGDYSFVGGGGINEATGRLASIVGGIINTASGLATFVGGGYGNVAQGNYSAIAGGDTNKITGDYSAIPGGSLLTIQSSDTFGFNGTGASHVITSGMTGSAIFMVSHFGVGTTTPQEQLDVQGRIVLGTNNDNSGVDGTIRWTGSDLEVLKSGTWQSLSTGSFISDSDGDTVVDTENTPDSDRILFTTNGTDQMVVTSSGNVGIGTISPAYELDVSGTVQADYYRHSTPVMFRVHRTTDQSISATTETTVNFTAEAFDLGSNFDLTSDSFTAPVDGVYWFSATARDTGGTDGNTFRVKFRVDGAVDMQHYCRWVSSDDISCRVEGLIKLNANQEVAFIVHHDDSGGISLKGNSGSTFFQGRLVEPTDWIENP